MLKKIKDILPLLIFIALPFAMILFGYAPKLKPAKQIITTFTTNALPDTVNAGQKQSIPIQKEMANQCLLIISGSWGNYVVEPSIKYHSWSFEISDSISRNSGLTEFDIACNHKKVYHKSVQINPLNKIYSLETFIGSKSVYANNGIDWSIITAFPVDKYYNKLPDSTLVSFNLHRPNETFENYIRPSRYGVSFLKIFSGTQTGVTLVGSKNEDVYSKEKQLDETPYFPNAIQIYTEGTIYYYADGRHFFRIKTQVIKDIYDNIVADGTLVRINIMDSDGTSRTLNAYTVGGIAELIIQNPSYQGQMQVKASLTNYIESNVVTIEFKPLLKDFDLNYNQKYQKLIVGPLFGPLNQFLSDGTEVQINLNNLHSQKTIVVKKGFAILDLRDLKSGHHDMTVSCAGIQKNININK